ncbi:filamentous haemagglutinin family protein [Rhodoferax sp.]|uniref:filamentous haemagglutinin family protein n=1 Tax=Rhodoferax sp. TaxID=50421 RepID=UPI001ECC646A|nr:filamentous haemagglutinin family protein [Rhodoferax sp.]MBT9507741.1 filamentous hemagglutinin family protein [Rhodoferax sp.]
MNRNCYRLVFNTTAGMLVPLAEIARGRGKAASSSVLVGALIASVVLANVAQAEIPVASTGGAIPNFVTYGQAGYQVNGNQAFVNQVGNKSILNWQSFNLSAGNNVQFRQVDSSGNLVAGASFTSLNRIWDNNPSVIAGSITQGAGQKANVILVNTNGIAFMGGSQVNLNSFTASSLDIDNDFILKSFLTNNTLTPQFSGTGGFIKVFEGARITAGSQGRVMLIAPTVVNKGVVEAPDGQVIAAAGTKVYLRSASGQDANVRGLLVEVDSPAGLNDFVTPNASVKDGVLAGKTVALTDPATDKLGHATNLGELTAARGNVTMVGYAVNQQGIARATTSVVANGSVYLLAKDRAVNNAQSDRGGRVTLAEGSRTEVLPEVTDMTGTLDPVDDTGKLDRATLAGLANKSQVLILGQDVRMASGAVIDAPSGEVNFIAMDNPGLMGGAGDPFRIAASPISSVARIHIADGARINVAGLENVQVSVARNSVEVELRGDELKDSPINRVGPLRSEKVYVDVNRALANANAGKSTLIAKDSLESYQGRLERTVAERSTAGGTVTIRSQGEAILESGAVIDLSGGSLRYTPGTVKTTLLFSGAALTDIADASAETRYNGIATRYVIDYGRWNQKEVIDLPQSYRYDAGYREGKNAGVLNVIGMGPTVLQAAVQGRTTVGELQRESGILPAGATLRLGTDAVAGDYKLNQRVDLTSTAATLPAGFGLGDILPAGLKDTIAINPALLGKDKVANLQVFSNQAAVVREALRTPQGGSVAITAKGILINADIQGAAGSLSFNARTNTVDPSTVPLDVTVADGVSLSARGGWANDLPTATGRSPDAMLVNGGSITLSAVGDVNLGDDTLLDVTGGGRVKPDGKLTNGNGGNVTLEAGATASTAGTHTAAVRLGGDVRGQAPGKGGTLTINTGKIQIGGTPDATALNLDADFVARGGFANFKLSGRDGVTVKAGAVLKPTVESLEFQPGFQLQQTGSHIENFTRKEKRDDRSRQTANLTLSADGALLGNVLLEAGAQILADDRAAITLNAGSRIEIQGQVHAAGGTISANLTPVVPEEGQEQRSAIWLGQQAVLDAAGAVRTYADNKGGQIGEVLAGGTVNLNAQLGYVVTEANSRVTVSGAAPVSLNVLNEAGGVGRMVGSDAGTVNITAHDGLLLDGTLQAQAGGASNRGGSFNLRYVLGDDLVNGVISPVERVLSVAQTVAPQATGLSPGAGPSTGLAAQAKVSAQALETAGFERIALKSRYAIRLENDLNMGAGRAQLLKEIQLDAPRLETAGGESTVHAHTVRLGNFDEERQAVVNVPVSGSGTFKADAQLLELAGNQTFTGMARAELTGVQEVRLAGVSTPSQAQPLGALKVAADLLIHGALVAPATYSAFSIDAAGHTVEFSHDASAPVQPLSALGSVTVKAQDIVQGGSLWAPFGQIDLQASNSLVFKDGSLTSVAAAPGSLTPFGKVENGSTWLYDAGGTKIEIKSLPEKSIRTSGSSINMQAGSKIDLAGGGDLQAYEFTVGPGGSRDILADKNTYAVLPGYASGFAARDVQESFDRASGQAVYLSGVPGLADGVYTLLPAHYALLPGAYAVKLNTGIKDLLPGQAYSRQDGVRIAAGYVTDSRANAPKDASWTGIEVLTRDQVRARSEFTLTRASDFFVDGKNRPQDAGLLSIATTGTDRDSLKLDASYNLGASSGGRGAAVDISALKLAITSGSPSGIDPTATQIDVDKLNALGAQSLFIGGTRSAVIDGATTAVTTTLKVDAESLTLANDTVHALKAPEVILAATKTLTLRSGSVIDAQGDAGDAGRYTTAGNGALMRAASTNATFERSGSPDRTQGTLVGDASSLVRAADSITLDATQENAFKGVAEFSKNGVTVAGNLAVGATRVNFGAAPSGSEGITYGQAGLDGLNSLKSLALTSYSTFDLYGDVKVGGVDASGKPTLQNLTLQGAGLAGLDNSGKTANLRAKNLTVTNPSSVNFVAGGTMGNGALAIVADTLTLDKGDKAIKGYSNVSITANEMVGEGAGVGANAGKTANTTIYAPTAIKVARISGGVKSDQTLTSTGMLTVSQQTADRALVSATALGAKWALAGTSVDFNAQAVLPSGSVKLTASSGDVRLGADAVVDVAGRTVQFFDVSRAAMAGKAEFVSDAGNVGIAAGARVDVSAAPGGDAGTLMFSAVNGTVTLADGSVQGVSTADAEGKRGDGARIDVDVKKLASFSALNAALNSGGFDFERQLRVRDDNVSVAATDTVQAKAIHVAVDSGRLDVAGQLNASGEGGGRIALFAKDDVNLMAGATLDAVSTGAEKTGGRIEIGTSDGSLNLAAGSALNVAGGRGGEGGKVLLRAPRINGDTDVAVSALQSTVTGASSVAVEAVKVYSGKTTLTVTGASAGTTLSLATISTDNDAFATNHSSIISNLSASTAFDILSGVEVRSTGDLTLGTGTAATDWNLATRRAGGNPGVLTLRATGNLFIKSNLSDGFDVATTSGLYDHDNDASTPKVSGPAMLLGGPSWSYRLIAGADSTAADPLAVKAGSTDVTLAAGKLMRTGTGDIRIASGRNIVLADNKSAIYTAGRLADQAIGFTAPPDPSGAVNLVQFSEGGGDVSMAALGDISSSKRSTQLYSNWLFRQGRLNADGSAYIVQPAWWVRFDQFQQGVGALGGGNVNIKAGGKVENVSASTPTQARMAAATPNATQLVTTGGGDVRVETGGDLLGGQYYADRGNLNLKVGGRMDSGEKVGTGANAKPLYTILALGDAQARVQALGDVNIHAVINPHLVVQSSGSGNNVNIANGSSTGWSLFSTYGQDSGVKMESVDGDVTLHNVTGTATVAGVQTAYTTPLSLWSNTNYSTALLSYLPPSLSATALQGDVTVGGTQAILSPAAEANLTLLAAKSVNIPTKLTMSDMDPALIPDAIRPGIKFAQFNPALTATMHAVVPVHTGDRTPVRVYAVAGDVAGMPNTTSLTLPKAVWVRAGQDVRNLGILTQHVNAGDISRIEAGRDVVFSESSTRNAGSYIWVGGPGRLEVTAGHSIDLGTSAGIASRGGLDNAALPKEGVDIQLTAGVGPGGIDYLAAVDRIIEKLEAGSTDDATLWQARWLTGDDGLNAGTALVAVRAVDALDTEGQRGRVREMIYTALRTTGRDSNKQESTYATDYARGYAALELVFPGISEKNPDGSFKNYQGGVNLFASRIMTERGGNIDFMIPGGGLVVGLGNTRKEVLATQKFVTGQEVGLTDSGPLGMVTVEAGDIRGFSRDNILVNQSRILTVGGGNILLWSSEGDIDAGKGKKTASSVPAPIIRVDSQGNVTQELQGAASGSGIGALSSGGVKAGDVDLIAPKGTVNAGDAGIRAGNLNIAAAVVQGADNISVSGKSSGTPVADTSAVSATASGATTGGDDLSKTTAALSQSAADSAKNAQALKDSFKPSFVRVDVLGFGE